MGKISKNEIESCYTVPIDYELSTLSMSDYSSLLDSPELIITFLMKHSARFVKITKARRKTSFKIYMKVPACVKLARAEGKSAFNSWKQSGFSSDDTHVTYLVKRREYPQKLRKFLNQSETDRIKDLCNAANSNENLFWKLIKGQRSSSQMSAFLVGGKLITDKNLIRRVANTVQELFVSFTDDPSGTLSERFKNEEVEDVCSKLKMGISGVDVDYEHIRFAGPPLWKLFFKLYQNFFTNSSVPESVLTGVILPLFKGRGAKANNKDNYRGITLFPTLCEIYEMLLLNRLESFAIDIGRFSDMQFGIREGVGCTEASFAILKAINHMIERRSNVFTCFLDVHKAFDTVWIDGLLFKLFFEFGIRGRMWLALRSLYTGMKAHVLCFGSLSRKFDTLQGTGQGRLLAPFKYKVYINGLLTELTSHT